MTFHIRYSLSFRLQNCQIFPVRQHISVKPFIFIIFHPPSNCRLAYFLYFFRRIHRIHDMPEIYLFPLRFFILSGVLLLSDISIFSSDLSKCSSVRTKSLIRVILNCLMSFFMRVGKRVPCPFLKADF